MKQLLIFLKNITATASLQKSAQHLDLLDKKQGHGYINSSVLIRNAFLIFLYSIDT